MTFGECIKALREERTDKLTQEEVAKELKTNQRKISRMETGACEPSLDDLRLICNYYNVSADYLLGLKKGLPYPKR
ncbi:MAG: helix-turn-helix transcriptional regulator [Clostridia bacterium]